MKPTVLYLSHFVPFPPTGSSVRLRAFQLLKGLSGSANVIAGCYLQNTQDWKYHSMLTNWCHDLEFFPTRAPWWSTALSIPRWVTPLLRSKLRPDPAFANWVAKKLEQYPIDRFVLSHPDFLRYVPADTPPEAIVLDLSNPPSEMIFRQAQSFGWFWERWLEDEAQRAYEREKKAGDKAGHVILSPNIEDSFRECFLEAHKDKCLLIPNGVDADYFNPFLEYPNPYPRADKPILFMGSMDYWPNIDAVTWFAQELFPKIQAREPKATFVIVGENPALPVEMLAHRPGIEVTGYVPDVRPYLAHAGVVVAPMRQGRRIQTKILEALSMAVPMVASNLALSGIPIEHREPIWCEKNDEAWVERILSFLGERPSMPWRTATRQLMEREYAWSTVWNPVLNALTLSTPATGGKTEASAHSESVTP